MAFTEEQSVRLTSTGGLTVDGVIRTRRIKLDRSPVSLRVEQREPIAVIVDRGGRRERLALLDGGGTASRLAWIAIPLTALVIRRVSRSRRKRGT